jgi:hypothetical protein
MLEECLLECQSPFAFDAVEKSSTALGKRASSTLFHEHGNALVHDHREIETPLFSFCSPDNWR